MPTTRGSLRQHPPPLDHDSDSDKHSSSSSSGGSIAARPVLRRQPSTGTPATLRPSRDPVPSGPSRAKRKREAAAPSHDPQVKRRRVADVRDSIEVREEQEAAGEDEEEEEDGNVDAAINATRIRPASNIAVMLPSSRRPQKRREASPTTEPPPGRLRIRRLKPRITSVEVYGELSPSKAQKRKLRHTVPESPPSAQQPAPRDKGKGKEVRRRSESPDQRLGSPELQSSALKRRPNWPQPGVYDVPDDEAEETDEPPSPLAPQPPRIVRGRAKGPKKSRRERQFAQNKRLSSIREEQNSGPSGSRSSSGAARQASNRRQQPGRAGSEASEESEEVEEDEEVEESEEGEDGGEAKAEAAQCSVVIQVLPYNPSHRHIFVSRDHLNNMLGTVGKIGWTGVGRAWRAELRRLGGPEYGGRLPGRTKHGRKLYGALSSLIDELEEIPNALDLPGQARFLEQGQEALNLAMSSVDDAVNTAKASAAAAGSGGASPVDSPFLLALVDDLSAGIVPMLVLSLQAAFSIGVAEPDAESAEFLPTDGTFTSTTVQYMMWISAWLSGLANLVPDVNPPTNNNGEARDQHYDPEDAAQNRARFGVMARKWKQHLEAGVRGFNEHADRERDIEQKKQRDMAIRAQKQRQQEEELARGMGQQTAFNQWLLSVPKQPRPLAQLFHRTVAHWPQSSAAAPQSSAPQSSAPQSVSSTPTPSRSQARSPGQGYPPWPAEEVEWLLGELARPDWGPGSLETCAEVLDRPVAEVTMEMERLARARMGPYR